ncbi:hypothetical protein B0H14DRAFT_2578451 [Mycena olivaceomarginata]|nr:hypothetical protein B0H14DRAFT_2578451 [Mycena olivaceomarginata]
MKDVEWRGSATKLERGCSSFIVFWETGLHSTQTDEGTAAETWLGWAGGFAAGAQSCNGCECSASKWTGACDTVLGGMDRKLSSLMRVLRSQLAARLCGRLDLCRGTGGVEAAPVQSGGSAGKRENIFAVLATRTREFHSF